MCQALRSWLSNPTWQLGPTVYQSPEPGTAGLVSWGGEKYKRARNIRAKKVKNLVSWVSEDGQLETEVQLFLKAHRRMGSKDFLLDTP